MDKNKQFLVVEASALPEMIVKTLEVKRVIAQGEERSSVGACRRVGISRSAFYKYKDSVYSYEEMLTQKILTLYAVLRDEPGVLSSVLAALHSLNANILTVNQNIPVDGAATVTISMRFNGKTEDTLMLRSIISELNGVVEVKILSGE